MVAGAPQREQVAEAGGAVGNSGRIRREEFRLGSVIRVAVLDVTTKICRRIFVGCARDTLGWVPVQSCSARTRAVRSNDDTRTSCTQTCAW